MNSECKYVSRVFLPANVIIIIILMLYHDNGNVTFMIYNISNFVIICAFYSYSKLIEILNPSLFTIVYDIVIDTDR